MAKRKPSRWTPVRLAIAKLEWANEMMRSANRAIERGDDKVLERLGFSPEHIADLKARGGFSTSSIGANKRLITYLKRRGTL